MFPGYLIWAFAGLFVLFGALIPAAESAFWRQLWAGLSTLSLGGFMISFVREALATGQIQLQHGVIRYAAQPRLFWAAVILFSAAGVVVLICGLWLLFFKG